jgi:hypothetical protein
VNRRQNLISVCKFHRLNHSTDFVATLLTTLDTGPAAVMNADVFALRDARIACTDAHLTGAPPLQVAAGEDEHCRIYNLQPRIVYTEQNAEISLGRFAKLVTFGNGSSTLRPT